MDPTERTRLVKQRGLAKAALARIVSFVQAANNLSTEMLEAKLSRLSRIQDDFESSQSRLEIDDESVDHSKDRMEFEDSWDLVESTMKGVMKRHSQLPPPTESSNSSSNVSSLRLPSINLPNFEGDYLRWSSYRDAFLSLIMNNETIDDVQKFHYLNSTLRGEAKDLLKHIPVTSGNLTIAWGLIMQRYDNPKIIAARHAKALLALPTVGHGMASDYRSLINHVCSHLKALEALKPNVPLHEVLLSEAMLAALRPTDRHEWEVKMSESTFTTIDQLLNFLETKCQALELIKFRDIASKDSQGHTSDFNKPKYVRRVHLANADSEGACKFCNEPHAIVKCKDFQALGIDERRAFVTKNKLCFLCISPGHFASKCRGSSCKTCNGRHNILLHKSGDSRNRQNSEAGNHSLSHQVTRGRPSVSCNALLATAVVNINDSLGRQQPCRVLLDSASQLSFISKGMAEKLRVKQTRQSFPVNGINNAFTARVSHTCAVELSSRLNDFHIRTTCAIVDNVTSDLPANYIDIRRWNVPSDIPLADPDFNKPARVDLILGAEVFFDVVGKERREKAYHPTLIDTKFGWILSGRVPPVSTNKSYSTATTCFVRGDNLDAKLQRFWELEELPTKTMSNEDKLCEAHFQRHTVRDEGGRFVIRLPVRPDCKPLGESRQQAHRRLEHLERRFKRQPSLKIEYSAFMHEYIKLGHMEVANSQDVVGPKFYLPHHAVFKECSSTTKLRVVFDGSAATSNGVSLNDILMVGPTVQPDLFSIVMKFRSFNVALSADIAKMYRQVSVHPDDRNLQKILWRESPSDQMQEYRLSTVTYGTAPAAFLATRCLKELALENQDRFPLAAQALLSSFYVDDFLGGSATDTGAQELQAQLTQLLASGGFPLRKWCSNSHKVMEQIPVQDRETSLPCQLTSEGAVKTLGILWHPGSDTFQSQVQLKNQQCSRISKRNVLSTIASIFDPLGLLGPAVIRCKLFLQRLWQFNLDWDEVLPSNLIDEWKALYTQLPSLNGILVERKIIPCPNHIKLEIHGFCDASQLAYGACVYIRCVLPNNNVAISLAAAKSRVAPVKQQSLPRLELCGALLLARLVQKVSNALEITDNSDIYLWTDSTIVLCWLQRSPGHWKTFVANRVSEIQELSSVPNWKHVKSEDNPADHISRGIDPECLSSLVQWWSGPSWLSNYDLDCSPCPSLTVADVPEGRCVQVSLVSVIRLDDELLCKYSSFKKVYRVLAYVLRFVNNTRSRPANRINGPLTPQEGQNAIKVAFGIVQHSEFANEIALLTANRQIPHSSKLRDLHPFVDADGILRVGGRLLNADVPYDERHPIITPSKHHLTKLLIMYEHQNLLHAGSQLLLSMLRRRFWIPNGRNTVKGVIGKCLKCFRFKSQTAVQLMGQLPAPRVNQSRPFQHCGVDYAGPVILRHGGRRSKVTTKAYIALFICMATKAIHLELVSDLATSSFLAALRRFIARRGKPTHMYSDNGTTFVGAHNELKRFLSNADTVDGLVNFSTSEGINWNFTPPRAPHFGGLWEAGIKSMKSHLKRVIGSTILTFEELTTLLTQIEACLNSRPLCALSDDLNSPSALTPGHFLIGQPLCAHPETSVLEIPANRLHRWQLVQQLNQSVWKRWSTEYLHQLQQRSKWTREGAWQPQIGDHVLIKEDNLPPLVWKLGLVEQLYPGPDNRVRVVGVKTANGQIKRPITKLCPLPNQ